MKKSTNYQLARAHELVFKNGVAFDDKDELYQVRSNTQKNKFYVVSKKGRNLECECKGFAFHGNCSHVVAVRVFQRSKSK